MIQKENLYVQVKADITDREKARNEKKVTNERKICQEMKIEKCANGHLYDADSYSECPKCKDIVEGKQTNNNQTEESSFLKDQTDNYREGLTLFEEGKYDKAVEMLSKVVWSYVAGDQMRQNAFSLLKTMADSGNTRAQCKCASIYEEGGRGWCDPEFNLNGERSRIILNGFQIVEVDYEKAAYYYDEAIKCGNADAAYYASRMYLAGFDSLNASLKDQWKSLQYLIKGIKLGSQMCIDDNMRMYFCCDDEMINKFRQLLFENRDEEAKEYLQWLIDNGYFMENGIKFYGIWKKDK